ncbi:MFS transporter, AAHS family, 3-hydroxyphenylpropionic acid transporter [Pseudomonas benzenivorans]|nr:3-(3-hydroxy-phenyl)propionate transporter MhpT [Pseudomonas benzenivorans]SDH46925.1 MFS transporter, AAHS family, 3-hydroxyphenylpropionic acid transporter [Pseudomonas benzenivorans]
MLARKAAAPASPVLTIVLCFMVALIEGFDLQAAGIAAPHIAMAFGLTPVQLGWLFSVGLLGLLPGALVGGWLADRLGRKAVLIAAVLLFGGFSLLTAHAGSYASLLLARLATGLGLGAALPILIALSSEVADAQLKGIAVSLTYCGVPLGGAMAALTGVLGVGGDWRLIFYLGGVAPILVAGLLALLLRESPVVRQAGAAGPESAISGLFARGRATATLLIWLSSFFTLAVLYMLLNWLPSLLAALGYDRVQAGYVQILFNIGGAAGSVLTGWLLDRGRPVLLVLGTYLGMLVFLAALGLVQRFDLLLLAGAGAGFCAIGAQLLLYALAPGLYPARIRATGVGATVAAGRLGSMAGPLVAGQVLALGLGGSAVLLAAAPGLLLSAGMALLLMRGQRRDAAMISAASDR